MGTRDAARHALYSQLENVLGHDHADTLMGDLLAFADHDVATKSDISRLEMRFDRLDERMDRLEERMDRFSETMISQQRFYSRSMVGAMVALTAIFSLVVTFFA